MESVLELDRQLFLLINHLSQNPILVGLMLVFSALGRMAAIWLVLGVAFVFLEKKKKFRSVFLYLFSLILAVALSYALVNVGLKPWVARMRPNFAIPQTILWGGALDDFSFPSGHATSSFAAAYVLGKKRKRLRLLLYLLAALISFSRVYLGFHYPSDVIVGAVLGVLIGKISIFLDKKI